MPRAATAPRPAEPTALVARSARSLLAWDSASSWMRRNFRSLKPSQPTVRQNLRIVGSLTPRSAATERTLERTKSSGAARICLAILTSERVMASIMPSSRGRISPLSELLRALFITAHLLDVDREFQSGRRAKCHYCYILV